LIFLAGCNPRYEATILNARIRKAYINNNTKIISLNDVGDLTYPYKNLDGQTQTIKNIFTGNDEISKEIINAKKPIIIIGESLLNLKSSNYLFNTIKEFLFKNDKMNELWNSFNVLSTDAATVGNYDLGIIKKENNLLENLNKHFFDIVYLLGRDNLDFVKKNEFIIYQGSHGDKGAEMADIILPGSAYTEQDGYFTNLEGKVQKANKASYPPGDSKEDWQIINELAEFMNNRKLFNDKDELESSMFNYLNLQKDKQNKNTSYNVEKNDFENEELKILLKDYYFSNVVARSSKTMIECNNAKINLKSTGTEG
jgi:NADH-quinone oxidoreductase subunit G